MRIDLNADVGEGLADADAAIVPLISSANIACGGHAGDAATMQRTIALALEHGVAVGAHPGYPDRAGFGRREIDIGADDLRTSIREQLRAFGAAAATAGATVAHVKPHGALYNRAARDPARAELVARAVAEWDPSVALVGLAGSVQLAAGRAAGLAVIAEAFADRAYRPDGSLRPRTEPGAVLADPAQVAAQAVAIVRDGAVPIDGGAPVAIAAQTICLHGDTPGAAANAGAVRAALADAGIDVVAPGLAR